MERISYYWGVCRRDPGARGPSRDAPSVVGQGWNMQAKAFPRSQDDHGEPHTADAGRQGRTCAPEPAHGRAFPPVPPLSALPQEARTWGYTFQKQLKDPFLTHLERISELEFPSGVQPPSGTELDH